MQSALFELNFIYFKGKHIQEMFFSRENEKAIKIKIE